MNDVVSMEVSLQVLCVLFVYFGLMVLERALPARPLPRVASWQRNGFLFFCVTMPLNAIVPAVVASLMGHGKLGAQLGFFGGTIAVLLLGDLFSYATHRCCHKLPLLWRVHQLHHSVERLDIWASTYLHPLELMLTASVTTVATLLLGVTPAAASAGGLLGLCLTIFQHANLRTPRWLGYVISRPEQHSLHHARGVHAYNYATFPIIDLLFGTLRNPEHFSAFQGFWDGASNRIGAMLLGRDVAEPPVADAQS
jgi:sterol desaturase/sphingolipid hydroxylase (fatty acid hydroxylase superfamily)